MEKVDNKSVHTGHRKRMLETYLSAGADAFPMFNFWSFC